MDYQQAIAYIQSFPDLERGLPGAKPARSLKMPLSAMKEFLQGLGNPQNSAKTIHITGSKGKGSTATFITAILKAAGIRTALFTSPHIHSYQERIAFDLEPISEDKFVQGIEYLQPFIDRFDAQGQPMSTFGILTALFFHLVSARANAIPVVAIPDSSRRSAGGASPAPTNPTTKLGPYDQGTIPTIGHGSQRPEYESNDLPLWQVVEVGLGGKDDVTNVFDEKEAVIITPISLEHTAILGLTRSAIAENKAGIITSNCLVVLAPQSDPDVIKMVKKICEEKDAQLIEVEKQYHLLDCKLNGNGQQFSLSGEDRSAYQIKLLGEHQINNAMTAIAVANALAKKESSISQTAIIEGLAEAYLPGRFEIIPSEADGYQMRRGETGECNPPLQLRLASSVLRSSNPFEPTPDGWNRALAFETDATRWNCRGGAWSARSGEESVSSKPRSTSAGKSNLRGPTIVLDGAHNGDSAEALAKTLQIVFPDRPVLFIVGVNQDKNLEEIWLALKYKACAVIATRSRSYRSVLPEEMRDRILACDAFAKVTCADDISDALEQAAGSVPDNAVICLCGSLYLVAEARERLINPQYRESHLCNRQ